MQFRQSVQAEFRMKALHRSLMNHDLYTLKCAHQKVAKVNQCMKIFLTTDGYSFQSKLVVLMVICWILMVVFYGVRFPFFYTSG